ncbi:MAG TPA: MucR family transcriptional regulator [Bryobacterales bacterium]|nr:MucR family transcriptional regulator [Bryobacterales bacterium]
MTEQTKDAATAAANTEFVELTAEIVAAYVGNNAVPSNELSQLIHDVYKALATAVSGGAEEKKEELKPAVPIRRSVQPDHIVCLECGKKFKSLKRHLRTHHNMTPSEYIEKWNLPADYPLVAPNYAKARSELAKKMGLGQKKKGKAA